MRISVNQQKKQTCIQNKASKYQSITSATRKMVGYNAEGPERDILVVYMEEKDRIERELVDLNRVLARNQVGMTEPLVDAEGYPRSDIDVYQVRNARHRIICLKNDLKEVMKHIERGLHAMHAAFMGPYGEGPSNNGQAAGGSASAAASSSRANGHVPNGHATNGHATNGHATNGHATNGHDGVDDERVALVVAGTRDMQVADRAFLKVNMVSSGSPADTAGIRVGDEVVQFGSVTSVNFDNLSQIAGVVHHCVGSRVDVRLRRGDEIVTVSLIPGPWGGRGLLGCNVVPV